MMAMLGVPFVVRAANIDEAMNPGEGPDAYLQRITRAKLEAVRATALGDDSTLLVADTIVVSPGGLVLGKPTSNEEARAMLERLAGTTHEVTTCFVLSTGVPNAPPAHVQSVATRVTFRALIGDEARSYAASGEGRDKAGGYAVQGKAAAFVERIEGSYTNVVGLPLCEVVMAMRKLGWW
jgi:septum formation protein